MHSSMRLARHVFSFESRGDVALNGKGGQHPVHCLLGPLDIPREARGLERWVLAHL